MLVLRTWEEEPSFARLGKLLGASDARQRPPFLHQPCPMHGSPTYDPRSQRERTLLSSSKFIRKKFCKEFSADFQASRRNLLRKFFRPSVHFLTENSDY